METEAWKVGHCAWTDDLPRDSNPYKPGSVEFEDWENGYSFAEEEYK